VVISASLRSRDETAMAWISPLVGSRPWDSMNLAIPSSTWARRLEKRWQTSRDTPRDLEAGHKPTAYRGNRDFVAQARQERAISFW
jgi:hypothetical protein